MQTGKYLEDSIDNRPRAEYVELLVRSTVNALSVSEYSIINIQLLANNKVAVLEWLYAMREHIADIAIWDKGHGQPAMCRNVMNASFELLVFLAAKHNPTRAIRTAHFRGTIKNVYSGSPQKGNRFFRLHAATFPQHLPTWLMHTFDSGQGAVYDPFCGTGSTLIAAEQLGRRCFAMEIEPTYCGIIIDRWEQATGKSATRLDLPVRAGNIAA